MHPTGKDDDLNDRPLATVQLRVAGLCGLTMFMAGFDTREIGYVIPAIVDAWMIERTAFGPVLAAGLLGLMIGALVGGPAADRVGRRPVLIGSALWFGIGSLATASASSVDEFSIAGNIDAAVHLLPYDLSHCRPDPLSESDIGAAWVDELPLHLVEQGVRARETAVARTRLCDLKTTTSR